MPQSDRSQLLKLARAGAETRLSDLRSEIDFIYRSFPDLRRGGAARGGARRGRNAAASPASADESSATAGTRKRRGGRRGWTAAQRREAAERMRKYWASRKA